MIRRPLITSMDFWVHQFWLDPIIKGNIPQCQTLENNHYKGQKCWQIIILPVTTEKTENTHTHTHTGAVSSLYF